MYSAIEMHLDGIKEDNSPTPAPSALAEYVVIKD